MQTLPVVAVLLAAVLHASWNALLKGRPGTDPVVSSFGLCLVWVLVAGPLLAVVPPPPPEVWPTLLASVAAHLVYFTLLVAAYRSGDLSVVYPVARGTPPLLVTAASAAMGVPLSWTHTAGVGVLTAGIIVLSPVRIGGWATGTGHAGWLALGCAGAIATYTLLDGTGTRLTGSAPQYLVWLTALQGLGFVLGALALRGPSLFHKVWERRWTSLGAGLMSAGGYGVALWAMLDAPIAAVAALREASVPMAALIGVVWLGERMDAPRLVAVGLVAVGAVLFRVG